MSEDIHRKLVAFLAAQFGRTEGRMCTRLDLVAAGHGGAAGTPLGTWARAESPELFAELGKIEELATAIVAQSQDHADTFGTGFHRFEVRTTQHLGAKLAHAFSLNAGGDVEGTSNAGYEPPNATGAMAQQMRHTEIYMRTQLTLVQTTIGTLERQNRSLNEECVQLREERRAHLAELEEARSNKDARDYEMSMGLAADERKNQAVGKVLQLLPVLATKFLGKEAMGDGKETPLSILIAELGKSLSPAQIAQIQSTLSMPQQMLLMEAMRVAQAAEASKAAADASKGAAPAAQETARTG